MRQHVPDAFTDKVFAGNPAAVCGSGRCRIVPHRTDTPGRSTPVAYQASPRGGALYCTREGERIRMSGRAALYAVSDSFVN